MPCSTWSCAGGWASDGASSHRGSRSPGQASRSPPTGWPGAWTSSATSPELEAAFARIHPADPRAELEAVVGELYDALVRLRLGADVLERSTEDLPELARIFAGRRRELFARYERYLQQRAGDGSLRVEHPQAVAHLLVELCSWAARRRPHDPDATQISDAVARQAVCRFATNALLPAPQPTPAVMD